jgi:ankyrin repeat protein
MPLGDFLTEPELTECRLGRKDLVQLLLENGGDVGVTNNDGQNAIQIAEGEVQIDPSQDNEGILQLLQQVSR